MHTHILTCPSSPRTLFQREQERAAEAAAAAKEQSHREEMRLVQASYERTLAKLVATPDTSGGANDNNNSDGTSNIGFPTTPTAATQASSREAAKTATAAADADMLVQLYKQQVASLVEGQFESRILLLSTITCLCLCYKHSFLIPSFILTSPFYQRTKRCGDAWRQRRSRTGLRWRTYSQTKPTLTSTAVAMATATLILMAMTVAVAALTEQPRRRHRCRR
jgi:hypothetical protein